MDIMITRIHYLYYLVNLWAILNIIRISSRLTRNDCFRDIRGVWQTEPQTLPTHGRIGKHCAIVGISSRWMRSKSCGGSPADRSEIVAHLCWEIMASESE